MGGLPTVVPLDLDDPEDRYDVLVEIEGTLTDLFTKVLGDGCHDRE